ncbi:MAG: HYExAFE family protein [Phycisphaerae bacterium]
MKPSVHYELAFEAFLRACRWPYVAVNEQRRAISRDGKLKSFDFVIHANNCQPWLVDIKGRKLPYLCAGGAHYWENWVTEADLSDMRHWQEVFGEAHLAVFVFAYWLIVPDLVDDLAIFRFRRRDYLFTAISVHAYERHARRRSRRWGTWYLSRRDFRRLAWPLRP